MNLLLAFVPGAPGGPELLIIFMILFMFVGPAVVIALVVWLVLGRTGDADATGDDATDAEAQQRIAKLEREVERLKAEVDDEDA